MNYGQAALSMVQDVVPPNLQNISAQMTSVEVSVGMPATNLLANSDFSNGTAGWSTLNSVISNDNGKLKIRATTQYGKARCAITAPIVGNKYYYAIKISGIGGSNYYGLENNEKTITDSTEHFESVIKTVISGASYFDIGDNRASGWTDFYVDNVIAINLTTTFGVGNEPSLTEMDTIMSKYPNNWFKDTVSTLLTHKELMVYLNKNKANAVQETPIVPTMTNSWITDTSQVCYYKSSMNEVKLRGSIKSGSLGSSAFTLPSGYRPLATRRFACVSNGAFGYVEIGSDGTIKPYGNNTYVNLDGVTFRIDV